MLELCLGKDLLLACYLDFVMMHCTVYIDAIIFIIRVIFFILLLVPI